VHIYLPLGEISAVFAYRKRYIIHKNTRKLYRGGDVTKKNEINRIRDRGEIRRKKVAAQRGERYMCSGLAVGIRVRSGESHRTARWVLQ